MDENNIKYTVFVTPNRHLKFLKIPFEFCITSPVFQQFIHFLFREIIGKKYMLVYIDNLIAISNTIEENIERLKTALKITADYGLNIKWKKYRLLKKQIEYEYLRY